MATNNDSKAVSVIFLVVGMSLDLGAVGLQVAKASFARSAKATSGTVVALDRRASTDSDGHTSSSYYPIVEYVANGRKLRYESDTGSNPASYDRGEHLVILYDPTNPKDASIDDFSSRWLATLIVGGIGLVFTAIGLGSLFASRTRASKRKRALQDAAFGSHNP